MEMDKKRMLELAGVPEEMVEERLLEETKMNVSTLVTILKRSDPGAKIMIDGKPWVGWASEPKKGVLNLTSK